MWRLAFILVLALWTSPTLSEKPSDAQSRTGGIGPYPAFFMLASVVAIALLLRAKDERIRAERESADRMTAVSGDFRTAVEVFARFGAEMDEIKASQQRIEERFTPLLTIGSRMDLQADSMERLRKSLDALSAELGEAKVWLRPGS